MVPDGIFYTRFFPFLDFLLNRLNNILRRCFNESLYGIGKLVLQIGLQVLLFLFKFFFDFRLSFSSLMARAHRRQTVFLCNFPLDLIVVMSI